MVCFYDLEAKIVLACAGSPKFTSMKSIAVKSKHAGCVKY